VTVNGDRLPESSGSLSLFLRVVALWDNSVRLEIMNTLEVFYDYI